jgi:hypothetical protein
LTTVKQQAYVQNFSSDRRTDDTTISVEVIFYLPQMEYEGSIGLVTGKMKKNIADFHVLLLLMAKKHDLSDNFFSVCHAPLPFA